MQDYKKTEDLSTSTNNPPPQSDPDAQVRQVLAYGTLLLVFFTMVVYLVTRDLGILAESTFVGVIVILVFTYYFTRKNK